MKTTKIDYKPIFKLFCNDKDVFEQLQKPFAQNGNYYATDRYSLITMPINGEMELHEVEKPTVDQLIPKILHEPIEIDVAKFEQAIIKADPLVDEFEDEEKECSNCDGEGSLECDLGHDHDCGDCDGEGVIGGKKPTGNKIPDERTVFNFMDSGLRYVELMRLIKAAKMLGVEKIYKLAGDKKEPFYFKVGNTHVLVMVCYIGDESSTIPLSL